MRMLVERSVVLSPLLNLAPAAGTGATLKHVRPLVPLGGSGISGSAMLVLSPDRGSLTVSVSLDRPKAAVIRLRRLRLPRHWRKDAADIDPLIVEIVARGWALAGACRERRFALDPARDWDCFAEVEQLLDTGMGLSELTAGAVGGIDVEPARAGPAGIGPGGFLTGRIFTELSAAECSATAAAAARHVELAILYARRLRDEPRHLR